MSSINEALRRASKAAAGKSPPPRLGLAPPRRHGRRWGGWLALSLVVAAAIGLMWYYRPVSKADVAPVDTAKAEASRPAPRPVPVVKPASVEKKPAPAPEPAEPAPKKPSAPELKPPEPVTAGKAPDVPPADEPKTENEKPALKREAKESKPPAPPEPPAEKKIEPAPKPAAPPEEGPPGLPERTALDHYRAGLAAQNRDDSDTAIKEYRQAILKDPRMTQAYLNLGNVFYYNHRDREKAVEMYTQVLRLDPGNKRAHNNLGVMFLRRGSLDQAETEFMAALQNDADYVDALYNMACVSARRGRKSLAMSYLDKAGRLNPETIRWAEQDEDFKALRSLPEFKGFIRAGKRASQG